MNRRLPIYFLIDVSESMIGEQIQLVEEGMATIIKELKSDPYALETAYISIIVFAGQSMTLVPLTDVVNFYPPKFPIGGGTSLGVGLGQLMFEMRKNMQKTTLDRKGDWKPIVFLFTDGVPTDDTTVAIQEWKKNWLTQANMVAVSFGNEADLSVLKELTENVLLFKNSSAGSYREFFRWVTASIKTSSMSVDANGSGFELAKSNDEIISKIDVSAVKEQRGNVDSNFAIFLAKCQNTKKPYLIKYNRSTESSELGLEFNLETMYYRLNGAFPVDNSYFELSSGAVQNQHVSTDELKGYPACPCCGNQWGFSVCSCARLHCAETEKITVCPWCGNQGEYGFGSDSMNIRRTEG